MKFAQKKEVNSDNDDDEDLPTTDDEDMSIKTDIITKIPDRLLYLIVCSRFSR